jgi:hypothetical protein
MALDDTRLRDLLTQSHDLHSDAMETTRVALDEYVELAHDDPWADVDPVTRRTTLLRGLPKSGVLAAAGLGTAMVALLASPAFANKTMDVQMLQTAASIENLATSSAAPAPTEWSRRSWRRPRNSTRSTPRRSTPRSRAWVARHRTSPTRCCSAS